MYIKNPERIILVSDMVKENEKNHILQGGSTSLYKITQRLKGLKISNKKIRLAVETNPKNLLKIT